MSKTTRLSLFTCAALLACGFGGAVQAQQVQAPPNLTFFVTSTGSGKGADLGGLAGADRHCQELAAAVCAGNKTNSTPVNARDRIGKGPWQNFRGEVVALSVDDLHSANNRLGASTSLTERGATIAGFGYTPNWHDMLTGSTADGRAFPGNLNMTCNNWTSSQFGNAMLGHVDRRGGADNEFQRSWNSAHQSRSCSQPDLIATGGNGLFYCFAAN